MNSKALEIAGKRFEEGMGIAKDLKEILVSPTVKQAIGKLAIKAVQRPLTSQARRSNRPSKMSTVS